MPGAESIRRQSGILSVDTTDTTWFPVFNTDFNANKNITITVTQTADDCLMSMTLRVKGKGGGSMVSSSWKTPVATSANLPLTSNTDGDARVTIDTGNVWIWYALSWHNKTTGGGGGIALTDLSATSPVTYDNVNGVFSFTEDANNRLVTDTEKGIWNGKQDAIGYVPEDANNKAQPSGYASLDTSSRVVQDGKYHNHQSGFEDAPVHTEGTLANAGKYTMATIECWMYDDITRDNLTLHTIAASGWLTPNEAADGAETYVCADRDTDTWVQLASIPTKDDIRYEPAYLIIKRTSSTNLHSQPIDRRSHGDMEAMYDSDIVTEKYSVKPGDLLGLVVDTSLNITMAGGDVYIAKRHKEVILAVTTATRQFKCYRVGATWTVTSNTTPVINNTQWNDTSSGLATLTDIYWNILYIYRGIEEQDHIYTVYGTSEYATSALAQADNSLPLTPTLVSSHSIFVGRVICQKSATTGIICESAFTTVFGASSAVTVHNSLSGRSTSDAHPTSAITNLDTALGNKITANVAITGATKTKITYDAKGLVTSGADATYTDVGAEASGAVATHSALTTGVHGVGAGTIAKTSDIPTAAISVTAETSYGSSSNAGSANTFSKGDHTHGTPATTKDTTAVTGILKGNGTTISAATVRTDYAESTTALATGILKNTTTTGAHTIAINSDLPAMSSTVGGAVPTPPNNTTTFLRGDGTFATPTGSAAVLDIYDEAVLLTSAPTRITFTGTGVTATEPVADQITVTINSGGGGGDGGFAFKYAFDTATNGSPSTGTLQYNNGTPSSATIIYIYETDATSVAIDVWLDSFTVGDWIFLSNADKTKHHTFRVSDRYTSGASIDSLPVTYQFGTGSFTAAETIYLSFSQGGVETSIGFINTLASGNYIL